MPIEITIKNLKFSEFANALRVIAEMIEKWQHLSKVQITLEKDC